MAVFTYTALDRMGKRLSGTIPAESRASAMDMVSNRGLSPIAVDEQRAIPAELLGVPAVRNTRTAVIAIGLVCVIAFPFFASVGSIALGGVIAIDAIAPGFPRPYWAPPFGS